MKKYTIEITQTEKKFNMFRENSGFTVYELIGFVELIRSELLLQAKSLFDNKDIKRKYKSEGKSGDIIISKSE